MIPVLDPTKFWVCPSCSQEHRTCQPQPHIPMHVCPALNGLSAPFVEQGVRSRHVRIDREDYVGRELVQCDASGRPVQAIVTERADGSNDCHVMPSTAAVQINF